MADSQDLIDFNVIESHKENIQALPSGRSAKALAQLYSPSLIGANPSPLLTNDAHAQKRAEYERELAKIDEADDPLDIYDRYVKWTLDAYPSAQATPQSQLLPLLERATKAFQTSSHYKNDPRYLKIWLHYIRFFSDAPREVFVFLSRHGIGEGLALYFEEYAAWLENAGRWNQAEEIYQMGIDKEARPVERLLRKSGAFQQRKAARPEDSAEPSSPALPAARPALAAKLDPFASASPAAAQQSSSTITKKAKSSKMAIFSDADEPPRPDSGSSSKGWDSIGTLADRKKENTIQAKPWAGEKLKGGKTNGGMQKMMIFKDQSSTSAHGRPASLPNHFRDRTTSSSTHEQQCVRNPKTGRLECVFVNLEAVYPEIGNMSVEYCFEELRARSRGLLSKDGRSQRTAPIAKTELKDETLALQLTGLVPSSEASRALPSTEQPQKPKTKERGFKIFEDSTLDVEQDKRKKSVRDNDKIQIETTMKTLTLNDENNENAAPGTQQETQPVKKTKREDKGNRTRKIKLDIQHIKNETKTIQLNMDSPTGPKVKRKKADRPEPTMTINTKEAMDEIYGIFAQPLQSQAEHTDAEEEDSDDSEDDDDDYTTGDESTATGKLSAPASEYGDETRNEILAQQKTSESDRSDNTGWSDFTMHKHVPKDGSSEDETSASAVDTSHETRDAEDLVTPIDEDPRTLYMPIAPEDYEHHVAPLPNHRLPFMTPIVERTESSLGAGTIRVDKSEYAAMKTPSRSAGMGGVLGDEDDDICSSPFDDVTAEMSDDHEEKRRVLQPIRTKSTKGAISLGQGSAKTQTAAKATSIFDDAPTKGPIIKDEQCNPMDPALRQTILAEMRPPLSSFEGYHEYLDTVSGRSAEIKKFVRAMAKANKAGASAADKAASAAAVCPIVDLANAHSTYTIKRELGAGTFAPVYLVENRTAAAMEGSDPDAVPASARLGKSAHRRTLEAIKMEEPPSTWEFFMLRQCHRRLGAHRATESIVRAHEMHLFRDECFLVEDYREQGTLLDLVNLARVDSNTSGGGPSGGLDETLAMFLSVELLRTVEALHAKQLIHGDLKADNVLVRFDDPGQETDWSPTYFPSGSHGWASKGVCLIDFGRGIDMRHFSPNVGFLADWKTTEADCSEMRELRPWTYQIDYHGLAGIIHSMLYGKYMETLADKPPAGSGLGSGAGSAKTYRLRDPLKRYWQTELWSDLFHLLLNPVTHAVAAAARREELEDGGKLPVVNGLRNCRERMEAWLELYAERGAGLKGTIARMEALMRERRRKTGIKA